MLPQTDSTPSRAAQPRALLAPTVPLAYARLVVSVAQQRGLAPAVLLAAAGLTPHLLEREQGELYAIEFASLVHAAMLQLNDPCLGFEVGRNSPPTLHGALGYALVSAGTLADALELGITYWRLSSRFMDVDVLRSPAELRLRLKERSPMGGLQRFAAECVLSGMVNGARHLMGVSRAPVDVKLNFAWPYHAAFERYAADLPPVFFDTPCSELVVATQDLDRVLPMGHPEAARQARVACDEALARMTEQGQDLLHQVADSLALSADGYPSMAQVAQRMGISPRTLARHLDRHGLSFRQVLEERRHQDARSMLASGKQAIEAIATQLGYNDPANFTRAFRRWAGCTPTQFRLQQRSAA